ncbi:M23 family metallopeptidase [Candidatus Peribacteria bacterium]|nr:M23 family metallopeptidase [Candidatus Peribacteria bacterium]
MIASRLGFRAQSIYKLKKPSILKAARQQFSFMIASLSLFTFVIGNMVGQHGWYSFWKTVLGKEGDTLITFVGTVPPIEKIPNYTEWAKYGGSKQLHTFNQVPEQVLYALPSYDQSALASGAASSFAQQVYSTLWAGGYDSPSGSHAGVDIDAPRGTPVQSIANGIVERVSMGTTGFGHFVMIRHPNAPDSSSPGGITTLRSSYAHMDEVSVREGEVVHKGQRIGTVGNTGLVFGPTGYHLYFEIDRDSAPYHPYWPFTSGEASDAGLSYVQAVNSPRFQDRLIEYTLNPMAFVQQYRTYIPTAVVAEKPVNVVSDKASVANVTALTPGGRLRQVALNRLRSRIARSQTVVAQVSPPPSAPPVVTSVVEDTKIVSTADVASDSPIVSPSTNTDVHSLSIVHSGKLTRAWQKVQISTLNAAGELVRAPAFPGRLYVLPDFGEAEIRPAELSSLDFVNGTATVHVLARSQAKPVFILTRGAFQTRSAPLEPVR